ncbi:MAG: hypothetical protein WBR18_15600 [Anaerolineales bacterium]
MEQLHETLLVRQPTPGIIRMGGSDGLDLLHRISTNAVADLPMGHARPTILTNALGRIVDVITILHTHAGPRLVASPGRHEAVMDWIQGYIFFQDDVQLVDETGDWEEIGIYGKDASEVIGDLIEGASPADGDALLEAQDFLIWRAPMPMVGFRSLLPTESLEAHPDPRLQADPGPAREAYESLRIAAGMPVAGHELKEEITPLDLGLDRWVSFEKGCYIGQEVIARMESRQQRPRRLVRLTLAGPAAVGSKLTTADATAGSLTSVAHHLQAGWIGLGLLHTRIAADARSWEVDGVEATLWDGEIHPA